MTNYFEGDITYDDDGSTYGHASNISKCTDLMNIKKYDKQSMLINNRLLSGVGCEFKVLNPLNNTKEQWYMRLNKALHTPYAEPQYLCLEGNDIQYWIADGVEFLGNLTGIYLKENQAAMLNMLLPKVPKEFQDIFGWQLVRVTPPPRDLVLLDLHYGSVDLSLKASLAMEKSSCLQVINHQAFKKPKPGPLPQALTIKTVVTLGSISLGMLECSQLEIGDLLFLQDSNFDEQGSGILSVGPLHLFVTIELINDQYQLAINRWGRNMSQTDTHPEDEELISDDMELTPGDGEDNSGQNEGDRQDSLPVGDLPINIDVRLGSITFTVQDLNNLVEGKLYTINSPGKGLVQLTHNDMELARGQLVEVDGKLAIEIQKRWLHS